MLIIKTVVFFCFSQSLSTAMMASFFLFVAILQENIQLDHFAVNVAMQSFF
jgi:hypothetical protein